jgi:hypothetical protein
MDPERHDQAGVPLPRTPVENPLGSLNTRRTFALASLAFLAACATKPSTPPRAANAGASEMPGGLWTSGDELPPPRYARPVSPIPKQPPQAAPEPPRAVQRPQTVGPEARPLDRSSRGIPATYAGSVIPRTAWTSWLPDRSEMDALGKIRRITVHHEGNGAFTGTSVAECRARIVNVLNGERGVGHRDIAYHYVIDPAGRVWEARDLRWQGRHVRNNHVGNIGVCCLGNFEVQRIPAAQLQALERFLQDLQKKHKVARKQIFTHQELSPTLCPGKDLQSKMKSLRARLA